MNIVSGVAKRLEEHGVESPRVNAEVMLTHLLKCRVVDLYTAGILIDDEQAREIESMVSRRACGEPLQYLTGRTQFYGFELMTEQGVFIPRPETEILVDVLIHTINQQPLTNDSLLILDLCTGSGNVGISLTKSITRCKIISSDMSEKALKLAEKNAALNGVSDRMQFVKADLLGLPDIYKAGFDIIVCNPPYIPSDIIPGLSREVRQEPQAALDGGSDGLLFYRQIINDAPLFLKQGGFMALELGDDMTESVKDIVSASGEFADISLYNDLCGAKRVLAARRI